MIVLCLPLAGIEGWGWVWGWVWSWGCGLGAAAKPAKPFGSVQLLLQMLNLVSICYSAPKSLTQGSHRFNNIWNQFACFCFFMCPAQFGVNLVCSIKILELTKGNATDSTHMGSICLFLGYSHAPKMCQLRGPILAHARIH